ncbi:MAG: Hpt domain-containing protein [SAR324 cluster bacterium]|nr:Hpt domain-containing protein [SAR324 cluster bacterium]
MTISQLPANELAELKSECLDLLQKLEESLLPLNEEPNLPIVDELFRSFHNLKGMAGFIGLLQMQKIASESESLLDFHRKKSLGVTQEIANIFYQGIDLIKRNLNDTDGSLTDDYLQEYQKKISDYLSQVGNEKNKEPTSTTSDISNNHLEDNRYSDIQNIDIIFQNISTEWTHFNNHNASNTDIKNLQQAFKQINNFAIKADNSSMAEVAKILDDFFAIYLKSPLDIPYKLISQAKEVLDYIFGLVFVAKNNLPIGLLKSQNSLIIAFRESFEDMMERKKNDIFARIENSTSFSFRIEADNMIVIVKSFEDLSSTVKSLNFQVENDDKNNIPDEFKNDLAKFNENFNLVHESIHKITKIPLKQLFYRFARVIKNAADLVNKKIELFMKGEHLEIDKSYLNAINISIIHILRNACDHGIESPEERLSIGKNPTGAIEICADVKGDKLILTIRDDGRGLSREKIAKKLIDLAWFTPEEVKAMKDKDIFFQIFKAGFSTSAVVTDISGRGVGMDVVNREISSLKGELDISSKTNVGMTIKFIIPYQPLN